MRTKMISLTVALMLGAGVAACGDDEDEPAGGSGAAAAEETPAPAPFDAAAIAAEIPKNVNKKPTVPELTGEPPAELVTEDIVEGKGPEAQPGDLLTMQYVGTSFSTNEQFDASWDRQEAFPFQLGGGQVIAGWDEGMVGMKRGGRRLLVIPPDMGYGPEGSPPVIGPNETLVFVVDLEKIG
ncbi:MAG TPA: FKBP-type peptidyl-prolyl cis-trans isomerase [Solirubrobacteraceae bacterium]|nr:FKBP-type peptidyl-prolyl cis-trans isomerase [Solirubrobacteraceae bacterium]